MFPMVVRLLGCRQERLKFGSVSFTHFYLVFTDFHEIIFPKFLSVVVFMLSRSSPIKVVKLSQLGYFLGS